MINSKKKNKKIIGAQRSRKEKIKRSDFRENINNAEAMVLPAPHGPPPHQTRSLSKYNTLKRCSSLYEECGVFPHLTLHTFGMYAL